MTSEVNEIRFKYEDSDIFMQNDTNNEEYYLNSIFLPSTLKLTNIPFQNYKKNSNNCNTEDENINSMSWDSQQDNTESIMSSEINYVNKHECDENENCEENDDELTAALWPKQQNQFVFTQEDELCCDNNEQDDDNHMYGEIENLTKIKIIDDSNDEDNFHESENYENESSVNASESEISSSYTDLSAKNHIDYFGSILELEDDITTRNNGRIFVTEKESDIKYETLDLKVYYISDRENKTHNYNQHKFFCKGAKIINRYEIYKQIGDSTFCKTYDCIDLYTRNKVCLKVIKEGKKHLDQGLDEIKVLKHIEKHGDPGEYHILRFYNFFYVEEHLVIVLELLKENLYEVFMKQNKLEISSSIYTLDHIKSITRQCLSAIAYLHSINVIHCDIKPENVVIKNYDTCEIKLIDFGSAMFKNDKPAPYLQSRPYRAPEIMLGMPYNEKIDIWSFGCLLSEIVTGKVLFSNYSINNILRRIRKLIGPFTKDMVIYGWDTFGDINDEVMPNILSNDIEYDNSSLEIYFSSYDVDDLFIDFIRDLLQVNPESRISAKDALSHSWLTN